MLSAESVGGSFERSSAKNLSIEKRGRPLGLVQRRLPEQQPHPITTQLDLKGDNMRDAGLYENALILAPLP